MKGQTSKEKTVTVAMPVLNGHGVVVVEVEAPPQVPFRKIRVVDGGTLSVTFFPDEGTDPDRLDVHKVFFVKEGTDMPRSAGAGAGCLIVQGSTYYLYQHR